MQKRGARCSYILDAGTETRTFFIEKNLVSLIRIAHRKVNHKTGILMIMRDNEKRLTKRRDIPIKECMSFAWLYVPSCCVFHLEKLVAESVLCLKTAFSRDQKEKIYVQDLLLQDAQLIWNSINKVIKSTFDYSKLLQIFYSSFKRKKNWWII